MIDVKKYNWSGWMLVVLLLLVWELLAAGSPTMQFYIPRVSRIFAALAHLIFSGEIESHLLASLLRFAIGYAIAALGAVTAGVALGYFRLAYSLFEMTIEFLRPMPSVAIIPVAILLLGIGDSMIVAVTVYASTWPILINTIDGVRNIDRTLIDTGRTFGLNRRQILRRVVLPAASPYVITGLRISLSIALILVTTAEMVVGSRGMGFFILDEERSLRSSNMYAGIILVALLGYVLNHLFLMVERQLMRWRRGISSGEINYI